MEKNQRAQKEVTIPTRLSSSSYIANIQYFTYHHSFVEIEVCIRNTQHLYLYEWHYRTSLLLH